MPVQYSDKGALASHIHTRYKCKDYLSVCLFSCCCYHDSTIGTFNPKKGKIQIITHRRALAIEMFRAIETQERKREKERDRERKRERIEVLKS